jgi:hypothetical protein
MFVADISVFAYDTNLVKYWIFQILINQPCVSNKVVCYSSKARLSFFEKTITMDAEKSTIKVVMIIDISITFHE